MVEPVEVDEANHAGKISTPVLSSRSGCQQRGETKNTLPSRAAGWLSTALNVWWISQGESERSERSQIEDVTNYSSNVAQGSQAIDRPKPYTQPRQRSSYGHYSATQDRTTAGVQLGHITHASVIQLVGILVLTLAKESYEAPDVKAGEGPKTEQISSGIILVVGPRAAHTRSLIQLKPTNVGDASSNRPLRRTPRHSSNTYSEPSSGQQQP